MDDVELLESRRIGQERGGIGNIEPGAVHAGVEVQAAPKTVGSSRRQQGPAFDLFAADQHGDEIVGDQVLGGAGVSAGEYEDVDLGQRFAQVDCFVDVGDEELGATLLSERLSHRNRAEAIGISFHHRGHQRSTGVLTEAPPVRPDGGEVDDEFGRGKG